MEDHKWPPWPPWPSCLQCKHCYVPRRVMGSPSHVATAGHAVSPVELADPAACYTHVECRQTWSWATYDNAEPFSFLRLPDAVYINLPEGCPHYELDPQRLLALHTFWK